MASTTGLCALAFLISAACGSDRLIEVPSATATRPNSQSSEPAASVPVVPLPVPATATNAASGANPVLSAASGPATGDAGPPAPVAAPPVTEPTSPASGPTGEPPASQPIPTPPTECEYGSIQGQACAPGQQNGLSGALVTIQAVDCHGQAAQSGTVSDANGIFTLTDIPVGHWPLNIALGRFSSTESVTVSANAMTLLSPGSSCVTQGAVRIAVISGKGDDLQSSLNQLGLSYDLFDGEDSFLTDAGAMLSDSSALFGYDLLFIDCGAAHRGLGDSSQINFVVDDAAIAANLQAFVAKGSSVYASDWAIVFALAAAPGAFTPVLDNGASATDPLLTRHLVGYAPQTVVGTVHLVGLSQALSSTTVSIDFPRQSLSSTQHWAALASVGPTVQVVIDTPVVLTCQVGEENCDDIGGQLGPTVLMADSVAPGGGQVVYSAFHSIAQSSTDIGTILSWVVWRL